MVYLIVEFTQDSYTPIEVYKNLKKAEIAKNKLQNKPGNQRNYSVVPLPFIE